MRRNGVKIAQDQSFGSARVLLWVRCEKGRRKEDDQRGGQKQVVDAVLVGSVTTLSA